MEKAYMGIDIGSISTKGVIINQENKILYQKNPHINMSFSFLISKS